MKIEFIYVTGTNARLLSGEHGRLCHGQHRDDLFGLVPF